MTRSPNQGPSFTGQQQRPEESGLGGVASTVKDKARDIASGASEVAGQAKDSARNLASSAATGAEQAWEATRQQACDLASDVAHRAENAWDSAGSFVRRYPVACLFFAVGLGFLLAGGLAAGARRQRW